MPTAYFGTIEYTVVPGDTLYSVTRAYNSTINNTSKFNYIPNPDRIYACQKIIIPLSPPEAIIYTVRPGNTLYSIARAYGTYVENLIKYNYLSYPYTIYPGQQLVVTASLR